jgi:5-oxoprolinase (ATP-hydrolysing) subunit A
MVVTLDLNCDLGEGFGRWQLGDDLDILPWVTSANVACGFHAGDPSIMRRVCAGAVASGVAIGAHVSYRDLAGFGRRFMAMDPDELSAEVLYQISALAGIARAEGGAVSYVKPHGALYWAMQTHPQQARAVLTAVRTFNAKLPVLGLAGGPWLAASVEAGLRAIPEAFVDRRYTAAGTLLPRAQPGAVLSDSKQVLRQVLELAAGTVTTNTGALTSVEARSICLHGDNHEAADLARAVHQALVGHGVVLRSFAR